MGVLSYLERIAALESVRQDARELGREALPRRRRHVFPLPEHGRVAEIQGGGWLRISRKSGRRWRVETRYQPFDLKASATRRKSRKDDVGSGVDCSAMGRGGGLLRGRWTL